MTTKKSEPWYHFFSGGGKAGIIIGTIIVIASFGTQIGLGNSLRTLTTPDRITSIAQLLGQLSATLIGFTTLAVFFFLGSLNTMRLRFLQTQRFLFRNLFSANMSHEVAEWTNVRKLFSEALGEGTQTLVWSGLIVIVIFSVTIVIAVLAVAFLDSNLISLGIGLVVSGTGGICATLVLTERELNAVHEAVEDAEELGIVGLMREKTPRKQGSPESAASGSSANPP